MSARHLLAPLAAAAALLAQAPAHAALTFFTDAAAFAAAVAAPATDSFDDLDANAEVGSPLARSLGGYGYTAGAAQNLFTVESGGDIWLSTNAPAEPVMLSGFSGGVAAIGALAFVTDFVGTVVPATITLQAFEIGGGSGSLTIAAADAGSFLGVVSTLGLQSASFSVVGQFVTLNDLTLAAAVPEPGTWALWLGGLAALGAVARRRRAV